MSQDQWHIWVIKIYFIFIFLRIDSQLFLCSAPEVLAKRGYFASVDWWSLGVVAYELLYGKRPFRGKTNSSLTQAILKETMKFPETSSVEISREGLSCLRGVSQI